MTDKAQPFTATPHKPFEPSAPGKYFMLFPRADV
jgi:hypothetical protein